MIHSKAVKVFREMVKDEYVREEAAAFAMTVERISEGDIDVEVYCEGSFGIMCAGLMDEISAIIVNRSKTQTQMEDTIKDVSKMLELYSQEKWEVKQKRTDPDQCEGQITMEELLNG